MQPKKKLAPNVDLATNGLANSYTWDQYLVRQRKFFGRVTKVAPLWCGSECTTLTNVLDASKFAHAAENRRCGHYFIHLILHNRVSRHRVDLDTDSPEHPPMSDARPPLSLNIQLNHKLQTARLLVRNVGISHPTCNLVLRINGDA